MTQQPRATMSRRRIAVLPHRTPHEFWKLGHAGADKAGRERDVEIIWKGPAREDDRNDQVAVVEDLPSWRSGRTPCWSVATR